MEYLKDVYNKESNENAQSYSVVDVYNKKKYSVGKYFSFLTELNESTFHLAECPMFPSPILVDFDIKKNGNVSEQLYSEDTVKSVILSYVRVLNRDLVQKVEKYKILLLEKPPRVVNGMIKNGFHLHFISISLRKPDLKHVFEEAKAICEFSQNLDDVSAKPWLLYGATKSPEEKPYKITKAYVVDTKSLEISVVTDFVDIFVGHQYFEIEITKQNVSKYLKAIMSIRCMKNFSLQVPNEIKEKDMTVEDLEASLSSLSILETPQTTYNNVSDEKIGEIVMSLNHSRADDYCDWIKIAMILTTICKARNNEETANFFRGVFHLFSQKSAKYDQSSCDSKWQNLINSPYQGGLGVGTLIYFAKADGNYDFNYFGYNFSKNKIPVFDYDIAKMVKDVVTDLYITHKDYGCYKYDSTVWKETQGWDGVFKRLINNWFNEYSKNIFNEINGDEESEKIFQKLQKKIKSYSGLNNITKSLFDLYFDENMDQLFTQKRNIAFNNCIFDVLNWKLVPGSPSYYFKNRIDHDIIDWVKVDSSKKEFVLDFFKKLFPNEELREYNIKNFARFLTGKNNFKQFQFWTGDGNNGKSACITLMEHIFNRYCMKIPKTMITGVVQKQGGPNPELFRLKDARIAIIDEVTENDFLDPGQIKGLTGNDRLYGRDLYQKSKDINEIIPMFSPILITNEVPIIKKPDDATWGRIRLINFESTFTQNVDKYKKEFPAKQNVYKIDPKMHDNLEINAKYFLSYFIHVLFLSSSYEDFNKEEIIPDKVIEGLEKFKEGQNILKKFLDENFVTDKNSTEIYSHNKLLKEYNSTRPKVVLGIADIEKAMQNYTKHHPNVTVSGNVIKGLARIDF